MYSVFGVFCVYGVAESSLVEQLARPSKVKIESVKNKFFMILSI